MGATILLRFFDERGKAIGRATVAGDAAAEQYATAILGTETADGVTVCLARFYVMDDNDEWVATGEEMEH